MGETRTRGGGGGLGGQFWKRCSPPVHNPFLGLGHKPEVLIARGHGCCATESSEIHPIKSSCGTSRMVVTGSGFLGHSNLFSSTKKCLAGCVCTARPPTLAVPGSAAQAKGATAVFAPSSSLSPAYGPTEIQGAGQPLVGTRGYVQVLQGARSPGSPSQKSLALHPLVGEFTTPQGVWNLGSWKVFARSIYPFIVFSICQVSTMCRSLHCRCWR